MAPHATPALRPKAYHKVLNREADPEHGHWMEHLVSITAILVNFGFIIGSWCFYSDMSLTALWVGDWIFIIGSFMSVLGSLHAIDESKAMSHLEEFSSTRSLSNMKVRLERNEFLENIFYLLAGAIFFLGSIFFMPGIYGDHEELEETFQRIGSYLFIAGSFGFVMATFFSAIAMAADPNHQNFEQGSVKMTCHYYHVFGLAFAQIGSVLFVVGSFLYRPLFAMGHPAAADAGTKCYVIGSILFTLESILNYKIVLLKSSMDGYLDGCAPRSDPVRAVELGTEAASSS